MFKDWLTHSHLGLFRLPWRPITSYLDLGNHVLCNVELQLRVPPLHVLQLLVGVLQVDPELSLHVLDLFPALSQMLRVGKPLFNLGRTQRHKSAATDRNIYVQWMRGVILQAVHIHRLTCMHTHTLCDRYIKNSLLASRKADFLFIFRFSIDFKCRTCRVISISTVKL